jgi:ribosomal protein L37AE/L43A
MWTDRSPCKGVTTLFYDAIWPEVDGEWVTEPDEDALIRARQMCAACPNRGRCIETVMTDEKGRAAENRFGVAAGTTPAQRWTMEKRGTWRCERCDRPIDPLRVISGILYCETCRKHSRLVAGIPDAGDGWEPRHTTLAKRVLAYLVEHHPPGDRIDPPRLFADSWGVRAGDMTTVYDALIADGTIRVTGAFYTHVGGATVAAWRRPGV